MSDTLIYYHGGRFWRTAPEIRNGKANRSQGGPGIYLASTVAEAATYAKGNKTVMDIEVDRSLRLLTTDHKVNVNEALDTSKYLPNVKGTKAFQSVLRQYMNIHNLKDDIPLVCVLNLACESNVLTGKGSPLFAKWLVGLGVDAYEYSTFGSKVLLVFNPLIITKVSRHVYG